MQTTIDALLLGKPTIIKENQYLSTKDYVEDFLNFFKPIAVDFEINVQLPDQITGNITEKDLTYNRVWIQAVMPDKDSIEEYKEVYGLAYALDTKTPVCKYYRAYKSSKTNNLVVFEPTWIETKELKPEIKFEFDFKNLMSKENGFERKIKAIKNNFISPDHLNELLGSLINKSLLYERNDIGGKIKLSPNDIIKAYNDVVNKPTSNYYVSPSTEGSLHNMYSSVCSQITQGKDIINRFEKTILVGMLFDFIKYEASNEA